MPSNAASASCRVYLWPRTSPARNASLPGAMETSWQGHAEERARQKRRSGPSQDPHTSTNGAAGAVRALREDLRTLEAAADICAAMLHHCLPEHRDLEAGLRLLLRLPPGGRRR